MKSEINERGNVVFRDFFCDRDRYFYDFGQCRPSSGWVQYDTDQDAWYFGVWVHPRDRVILTYAEGDEVTVTCPDELSFKAELMHMESFYGAPPPAFTVIDTETGDVTYVAGSRPCI